MPYARVSLARASRPAQKQHSPPLSAPARTASRRTHAEPIRTTHRAAQRRERYPGARPRVLGCKPPPPGIGAGEYVRDLVLLTRRKKPMLSTCQLPGWRMARAGRLVSLVAGRAAVTVTPPLCDAKAFDMRNRQCAACSFTGACCAAHTWVHASPLSGPSRRRRRPRDAILYAA
jgi:hypothetical protein